MDKLKTFLRRLSQGSLKRFFRNLELVHSQTGKNRLVLFVDMAWCMLFRGVGYLDYVTFGFAKIGREKRDSFMTMNDNIALVRRLNQREAYPVLNDKLLFNERFSEFLGREHMDLREGLEIFTEFCRGREDFFAKEPESFGGTGVRKVKLSGADVKTLYHELMAQKLYLVEETIHQHPELDRLCSSSVNTLRITTVVSDRGTVRPIYSLLRIGSGDLAVDNISSGGMYTLLSTDGEITHPAFRDKTVSCHEIHPGTGERLLGFRVPFFREAVALCCRAALVERRLRYVGWDVAITERGPVLVEGNNLPGYDMCQNHIFHDDGMGMKPVFEQALRD